MSSRNPLRFTVLSALALVGGCASTPEAPLPELSGTWAFSGVASEPISGTMEFFPGRMVLVDCQGARRPSAPTRYEVRAGSEARVHACGKELRVRRDEDGSLYAMAQASSRAPTSTTRTCTDTGAGGRCIRWSDNTEYRETRGVEVRIEMTRLRGSG
jgi:hypothetical protein